MSKLYTKKRKYKHKYIRKLKMYKLGTKIVALVLVAVISLSAVIFQNKQPPADAAAKVLKTANVGYPNQDSITATLYDDGVLDISIKPEVGAVELWNNSYNSSSPFKDWTGIQSITFSGISDTAYISAIGENAFYNVNIDGSGDFELNLPERLTYINSKAFYEFGNLDSNGNSSTREIKVNFPESLQAIEKIAFCNVKNLKSVKTPSKVNSIGLNAFKGCSNLSSITLSNGINSIEDNAFENTGIQEVTIPSSVRSISDGAFNSSSLKKVYFEYQSKDISAMNSDAIHITAFSQSASLIFDSADIKSEFKTKFPSIKNSEIAPMQIQGLASSYDEGTQTIPASVTVSTKEGSPGRRTYSIKESNVDGINAQSINATTGNLDLSTRTSNAIGEFTVTAQVIDNNSVKSNESYDYAEFKVQIINSTTEKCGTDLISSYNSTTGALTITGNGDMFDYDVSSSPWASNKGNIKSIVFAGGNITKIGAGAFKDLTKLESIEIPSTVTSIGENAFENCYNLTSAKILGSLNSESTGSGIFRDCRNLAEVTFGEGTTAIPDSTFLNCSNLSTVTLADSITAIGVEAFSNCSKLSNLTLPSSLISIKDKAFSSCSGLTSIVLPNSLTTIEDEAFSNCTSLENITFSTSLSSIGTKAFFGCSDLNNITLPSSLRSIGDSAFLSCSSLSRVDFNHTAIEMSKLTLGKSAFNKNPNSPKIILKNEFAKKTFDYEVLSAEGTTTNASAAVSSNSLSKRTLINQWQAATQNIYNSIGRMTARYNVPTASVGDTVSKDNLENFVLGGDHSDTLSLFFNIGSSDKAVFTESGDLVFCHSGQILASASRAENENDSVEDYNKVSNIQININPGKIQSVTNPQPITNLPNGTPKTAEAFGLPNDITVLLEGGNTYSTTVTWDVDNCNYNKNSKAQQSFIVNGSINTNDDIENTNGITAFANVTVNAGSADPSNPSNPSDPSNPSNPSNPSDPSNPSNPSNPSDPSNPSNPSNPSDPSNPSNPSNPSDPSNPSNPSSPSDPSNPSNPSNPSDPSDPSNPSNPSDPSDPSNPSSPSDPSDTSDSSNSSDTSDSSDSSDTSGSPTPGNTSNSSNTSTNAGGTTSNQSGGSNTGYDSYSAAQATGERSRTILSIISGVYIISLCSLIILRKRIKKRK